MKQACAPLLSITLTTCPVGRDRGSLQDIYASFQVGKLSQTDARRNGQTCLGQERTRNGQEAVAEY